MYIRTREEAVDALGAVLAMPDPAARLLESSVRIMLCLDPDARRLLVDGQAFLLQGGVAPLRARRRTWIREVEPLSLTMLEAPDRVLAEEIASGLDVLRFADLVREVFPALRGERWRVARAVRFAEDAVREAVVSSLRERPRAEASERALYILNSLVDRHRPSWADRAGALWTTCKDGLRTFPQPPDPDRFHAEVDLLFELTSLSDERAGELLAARDLDASEAARWVRRLEEVVLGVRGLPPEPPPAPGYGTVAGVA